MDPLAAVTAVAAARAVTGARSALTPRRQAEPATPAEAGDRTELSAAGKLLEALLTQTETAGSGVDQTRPLLPAPPAAGPQAALAQLLQRSFSQSGLFYESHLVAWTQGELPLSALAQEPQGRLLALPFAPPPAVNGSSDSALPGVLAHARSSPGSDAAMAALHAAGSSAASWQQVVDPRLGTLVHQQLLSLDSQVMPWQGQLWPGQQLEWTIAPEVDADQQGSAETATAWTSHLRLDMPELGLVDAELRWSGAACSLRLVVPAERLAALRSALPELAARFKDAGLRAERILITAQRDAHNG